MIQADPDGLYALADLAVGAYVAKHEGAPGFDSIADVRQEAVTWLLESPGRCWVRDIDGFLEDPEAQLVADLVAHLDRVHS